MAGYLKFGDRVVVLEHDSEYLIGRYGKVIGVESGLCYPVEVRIEKDEETYDYVFMHKELRKVGKHAKAGEKFDHPSLARRMDDKPLEDGDLFVYVYDPDKSYRFDSLVHCLPGDADYEDDFAKRRIGRHADLTRLGVA